MNFTLLELNELIYCLGHTLKSETSMVNRETARRLYEQLADELEARCAELDKQIQPESMFDDIWTPGFGQPVTESADKISKGWSNAWPEMPTGH